MPESQYRARQVGAKTQEVLNYHRDDGVPGKPLHILIPGGLVALAALAVIVYVAYLTWLEHRFDQTTGIILLAVLAPFYIGGVFLFSYGYELYNIPRALRLTAIIVFVTLAAVVIVAVLFFILGSGNELPGSSKKEKSSGGGGGTKVHASNASSSSTSSSSSRGSSIGSGLGSVVFMPDIGGGGATREVTREVVKEVQVPVAPRSVNCPYCQRSYVPSEQNYACPACGAATPKELIEESEQPRGNTGK